MHSNIVIFTCQTLPRPAKQSFDEIHISGTDVHISLTAK